MLKTFKLPFKGQSMWPTLKPDDLLEIECCPKDLIQIGDIVVYYELGELVVHRLVRRGDSLIVKGDAALDYVHWNQLGDIFGRVKSVRRAGQLKSFQTRRKLTMLISPFYTRETPRLIRGVYGLLNYFFLRSSLPKENNKTEI